MWRLAAAASAAVLGNPGTDVPGHPQELRPAACQAGHPHVLQSAEHKRNIYEFGI